MVKAKQLDDGQLGRLKETLETKTRAKKGKQCKTGKPCGGSCIAQSKTCGGKPKAVKTPKSKATSLGKPPKPPKDTDKKPEKVAKTSKTDKSTSKKDTNDTSKKTPKKPTFKPEVGRYSIAKRQVVNPYAIPDLTVESFNIHLGKINRIKQSDEDWAINFQGSTKALYKREVLSRINMGLDVSDTDIAASGAKLTKAQKTQLDKNREEISTIRQDVNKVNKAIEYSPTEKNGTYKPFMNEREALEYVKGSAFGNFDYYHGNSKAVIDSVVNDGVKPEKNTAGIYGQGFYLATSRQEAEVYAYTRKNDEPSVIATKVYAKNPYFTTSDEITKLGQQFEQFSDNFQSNGVDSKALTDYLKVKGYDSVYVTDKGYVAAFDRRQVVAYQRDPLNPDKIKALEAQGAGTDVDFYVKANAISVGSETAQALNSTK